MAIAARLTDVDGHPVDRHMTADEFLELVDRLPHRAELIDGEVVVNSPSHRHQDVVLELAMRLRGWTKAAAGRGQCGIDVATRLGQDWLLCDGAAPLSTAGLFGWTALWAPGGQLHASGGGQCL